jgi:hypothetical protein
VRERVGQLQRAAQAAVAVGAPSNAFFENESGFWGWKAYSGMPAGMRVHLESFCTADTRTKMVVENLLSLRANTSYNSWGCWRRMPLYLRKKVTVLRFTKIGARGSSDAQHGTHTTNMGPVYSTTAIISARVILARWARSVSNSWETGTMRRA